MCTLTRKTLWYNSRVVAYGRKGARVEICFDQVIGKLSLFNHEQKRTGPSSKPGKEKVRYLLPLAARHFSEPGKLAAVLGGKGREDVHHPSHAVSFETVGPNTNCPNSIR